MILGIDLGNYSVKTSETLSFKSKISNTNLFDNEIVFEVDGKTSYIGEGTFNTEYNKVKKDNLIPLLYSAIAMSSNDVGNSIVLGLPIEQFKMNKEEYETIIIENKMKSIKLNGKERNIIIENIKIAPEGASVFYNLDDDMIEKIGNEPLIIIDIGGRTTDISVFELKGNTRKITNYKTIPTGMLNIYNEITNHVNRKYTESFTLDIGEHILEDGLFLNGEKQDISFIDPILKSNFDEIYNELQISFKCNRGHVLLTGGGSSCFVDLFKEKLKNILVSKNPIFDNAIGFRKVGEELWQQDQ